MKKQFEKWEYSLENMVLEGDNFYISYNENPGGGISVFQNSNGSDETALCKGDMFYILNGDFRAQYERLIAKGFDTCYDFYKKNKKKYGCEWSSDYEERN